MRVNENDYFNWMVGTVTGQRFSREISYLRLLSYLDSVQFTYIIPKDENRAEDGLSLRYRFSLISGDRSFYSRMERPCSVLEMMVALAIDCEECIMDDPTMGNRTGQWFWGMITSLGLNAMTDDNYDESFVVMTIRRFLTRKYAPNGKGGLFTIRNCGRDLRTLEIWHQVTLYLDTLI